MSEPRRIMPLPARGRRARAAVLARADGALADGRRSRRAPRVRARDAASATSSPSAARAEIELERLEALAVDVLGEEEGRESIQRLRRYQELRELDLPIMVFIGGATGTGKSTVATELAYRFGITRVTSTDFVRQTMRAFFSRAIHAGDPPLELRGGRRRIPTPTTRSSTASCSRRGTCSSASRASSERALEEGWSLVLEGVHLVPGMVELPRPELAVSVFVVLSIEDEDEHVRHFRHRDEDSEQRPESRYLERFDDIRRLQEVIVARAHRQGVPVIENEDADRAARTVADLVLDAAEQSRTVTR